MSDDTLLNLDISLFQMRQSGMNRSLSDATSRTMRNGNSDEELKNATDQFESLLLNMMIREMRATVPESTFFPDSMAKKIYTGMLDEKTAENMTKSGGIGISRMLFDQLKAKM